MQPVGRRAAFETLTLGGAALAIGCGAAEAATAQRTTSGGAATTVTAPAALAGDHELTPLPFPAGSLNGISERLITSHYENNYAGAVRNLNAAELQIAATTADTPAFVVAALHERELNFRNSKTLHEQYFGNLGGDGRRSGAIETALAEAYGSSSRWESDFRATGSGLGGGSGWVTLAYELETGAIRNAWSGNHTQSLASSVPLLVMDMYEHAYQMDFGAAVPRYLDAFFTNVKWDEVNARLERARRMRAAIAS